MAISPMDLEQALDGVNELALPVLIAFGLYPMVCRAVRAGVSGPPHGRAHRSGACSRVVRRGTSLLGLALSLSSPAAAGDRVPSGRSPARSVQTSNLRSEPGRFPPSSPARPGRTPSGAVGTAEPPWADKGPAIHPAVHARSGGAIEERLFPRSGGEAPASTRIRPGREPAVHDRNRAKWHAVLPGETLWSIAADRLGTDDVRRVARYWPRIHRANREVIGSNPSLIRPGQVLELPPERI